MLLFVSDEGRSYTNMDSDTSWRGELTPSLSLSGMNSQQEMYEHMNSLLRTNENLSQEIVNKNATIDRLESSLQSLNKELYELRTRVANQTKSTKIDKQLSATVKQAYASLADSEKFHLAEHFLSPHNISTKTQLIHIIREDHVTYTDQQLNDHIRAKYTNDRRRDKEVSSGTTTSARKRKMNARRHLAYNSRLTIAKKRNMHTNLIAGLTAHDMSDHESDGDDQFIVKKPTWRSEQVDQALQQLDNFAPLVRKRVNGSPSKRTNACDN